VVLLGVVAAVATGLSTVLIADPTRLHGSSPVPNESNIWWVVSAAAIAIFVPMAVVHWRRWRLGHDVVQLSLVLAASMSAAAIVSLKFGAMWRLSWWDYHGFLLSGFAGAVYAVVVRRRRTSEVDAVLATTFDQDPLIHIVEGYPDALNALVRAVEIKDGYTFGHSQRTAELAVRLGLHLRLGDDDLRALARGAFLHDVGKIAIPDSILNKPGRLTADEREVIQTHPQVGFELVSGSPGLEEALPVVLHHHERWDGEGYPAGLAGRDIPLVARVAAVADVWDALTSDRSYRPGLDPADALAHIQAGRGTHFDPRAVDAMVALAADWGYAADGLTGNGDEAWRAIETCHDLAANNS
jgi:HD-GYP domain-containing protein (c-di-GMP phosphodiesterase class II)